METLYSAMLAYQPSKRISAKDAMRHPWFDDLDKSALKRALCAEHGGERGQGRGRAGVAGCRAGGEGRGGGGVM